MKKLLLSLFLLLVALPASASLWEYYGGNLPSIEERAEIAQQAGIVQFPGDYYGTLGQNLALETFLRGEGYSDTFGSVFRPSNYKTTLAESLTATASTTENIRVSSITIDGHALTDSDVGDYIILTINPGAGNEERIACTGGTYTSGTDVGWERCTRGMTRYSTTAVSTRLKSHSPGETVIISNDDAFLAEQYAAVDDEESIYAKWTYRLYPEILSTLGYATSSYQFVTFDQLNAIASQGVATSTESVFGGSYLATQLEMASSTFDAGMPTVLYSQYSTSSPDVRGIYIPVSENDGYLNQGWLDLLNESWTFNNLTSATSTFTTSTITQLGVTGNGTSTFAGGVDITGDLDISGNLIFGGDIPETIESDVLSDFVSTTAGTLDTDITLGWRPKKILLNYFVQGHTDSGSTNIYTGEFGDAMFSGTTMVYKNIIWQATTVGLSGDNGAPNPTNINQIANILYNHPESTSAISTGTANGNNSDIQTTLSISSVDSDGFTIRIVTAIGGGTNSSNARVNLSWIAFR